MESIYIIIPQSRSLQQENLIFALTGKSNASMQRPCPLHDFPIIANIRFSMPCSILCYMIIYMLSCLIIQFYKNVLNKDMLKYSANIIIDVIYFMLILISISKL